MQENEAVNGYDLHLYGCEKLDIPPLTRGEWVRNGKPTIEEYSGGRRLYYPSRNPRPATKKKV